MAPTKEQLRDLHQEATRLFEIKLARIPKRMFAAGSHPTIHEYYTKASTVHIPSIPEQYQLEYLFANYNALVAVDYKVIKSPSADIDLAKAIWYWQFDKTHSLSRFHAVIRCNIIAAVIVGASAHPDAHCTGSAQHFLVAFVSAWKEATSRSSSFAARDAFLTLWAQGQHDVVQWRSKQLPAMRQAVKLMRIKVPELPFPASEFWERVRQQPEGEWEKHGHAWAAQWIVHMEKEGQQLADEKTEDAHVEGVGAVLSGLGVEEAPGYLCEELFEQPHVRALLQNIDEPVPAPPKKKELDVRAMWMDPSAAIDLVRGLGDTAVDGLDTALKNMSFMT